MQASTREVEVLIAVERDGYYEELLQAVTHGTTPAVTPPQRSATPLVPAVSAAPVGTPAPLVHKHHSHIVLCNSKLKLLVCSHSH
eukprot:4108103-Amphidinium_carterae.2